MALCVCLCAGLLYPLACLEHPHPQAATSPSWLATPMDGSPLELQLAERAAQLGREQHGWADECANNTPLTN